MIEAERAALAAESLHSSLSILEREMTITLNYLNNIATSAALLAGFIFSYIAPVWPREENINRVLEGFYICVSVLSFGLLIYTVLLATLSASLAPTKAFKDREHSSMRTAIENLKSDKDKIITSYQSGVSLFLVLIAMQAWVSMQVQSRDYPIFIAVMVILTGLLVATVVAMNDMYKKYAVSTTDTARPASVVSACRFLSMADTVASNTTSTRGPASPTAGISSSAG